MQFAFAILFPIAFLSLLQFYLSQYLFRPLRQLRETIDGAGADLAFREKPLHGGDEIGELADAITGLIQKWKGSLKEERRQRILHHRTLIQLREKEAQIQNILDRVSDGIIIIDQSGRILSFNAVAEQMFGYTAREIAGENINRLMPEPHKSAHDEYIRRYLRTGQPKIIGFGRQLTARRKDGTTFTILLEVCETRTNGERVFTGTVRDISEKKLLESALREVNDMLETRVAERTEELSRAHEKMKNYAAALEQSHQDLEDFVRTASHDLQEPLRKIIILGDLLTRYAGVLDEKGIDTLHRIQKSAGKMQGLLRDLYDLFQITSDPGEAEKISNESFQSEILAHLETRIRQTGGRVEFEWMGEANLLSRLRASRFQLSRLLHHLVSNALKFHHRRTTPRARVKIRRIPALPGYGEIIVQDNGMGFDEKYLNRIFKPFQRLHADLGFPGNGMGLTICHRLVTRLGGFITARSRPDRGSEFIVTLPLRNTGRAANRRW